MNPHSLGETDFKSAASTIPPLGHSSFIYTGGGGVNRENFEDAFFESELGSAIGTVLMVCRELKKSLKNALHS